MKLISPELMTLYYGIYQLITFSVNGSVKAHFYGVFTEITDKTFIKERGERGERNERKGEK
ncbi:hypothetical protein RhiirB3_458788 [Rhizophagus irregularis]|nr:hypothetical protein RhiirB3_458788 [Rhizophagus irregularis]